MKRITSKNGQALILAYITITFLIILTLPLFNKIAAENAMLTRQKLEREAFYFAEGGVEDATDKFISAIANFQTSPDVTRYPASGSIETAYSATAQFPSGVKVYSVITEAEADFRVITDAGTSVQVKSYIVNSACTHPKNSGVAATVNQAITLKLIYTFQHAVFYADDLEILPGRDMTFTGRIHTNKDMYLQSDGKTLTLNSESVHSAGNIYNRTKDGRNMNGEVSIKKAGTGSYREMDGLDSSSGNWLTESQDRWNAGVKSSVHGITKLSTPVVGSIQPDGYYNSSSDVKILNGVITKGGVTLVEGIHMPYGTIVTDTDFYSNREARSIRMTNIDLKKLAGYAPGDSEGHPSFTNNLPANGLMYATRNDAGPTEQPGVRLVNGSKIYRNSGVTLVTNDPIYIQGDYNTASKKPCAVIGDSINILSNNWNDSTSQQVLDNRVASPTTVNTCFIAGVDNTTSGHYNGGLENYPRLHEKWTDKVLYIRGSFVELWNNQIAQGAWQAPGGTHYRAPNRNWDYDTDLTVNNMPPFTPWAVEAQRGAWWKSS